MTTFAFQKDQIVLCSHGPLLYDAKIKQVRWNGDGDTAAHTEYHVHYQGWPPKWDEWVQEDRLMEINPQSRQLQADLKLQHKSVPMRSKKKRSREEEGGNEKSSEVKVVMEAIKDMEEKRTIRLVLPTVLKLILVDDCDRITRQKQIIPVRRQPDVYHVLKRYENDRLKKGDANANNDMANFVMGLEYLFRYAVGKMLLYRVEREQYADFNKGKKAFDDGSIGLFPDIGPFAMYDPVNLYGAEHLLRLLVKLPELLLDANMSEEEVVLLNKQLADFVQWLVDVRKDIFLDQYEPVPQEYLNAMRN